MISFRISAPGKVILFGEHAVVYGRTAVAASLDRRTSLGFSQLGPEEPFIHLEMPKVELSARIAVNQARELLLRPDFPRLSEVGHEAFLRAVREALAVLGCCPEDAPARQRTSLECFLYALLQVAQTEGLELDSFRLALDTELSVGAGLGSSASFSVCLVAAFLRLARLQREPAAPGNFGSAELRKISEFALNCEKIMHGAPSGIDNSICTFGSLIEFRKAEEPSFVQVKGSRGLRILLVDTRVGRSTKVLVDKLAGLVAKYPQIFHQVLEAINGVSKRVIEVVKEMQDLTNDDSEQLLDAYRELSILVDVNQGLLATCQVSHSSLDLICMLAKKYGFSAKLTGAGGGGFAYVLIPPETSADKIKDLSSELITKGFTVSETNLGGSGVQIHNESC